MKIIYIVDFPINGSSGKHKATREKARALGNKVGTSNFMFIHPRPYSSGLNKIFNKLFFDILTFRKILLIKNIDFVIQRVLFMPATRLLLYFKGVKVVSEYHADFKEEIPYLNKTKWEKTILYLLSWFYNLNYKLSNGIIFNHPYLQEKFDKKFKKPSIYSYNGSNITDFNVLPMEVSRKLLDIPENEKIFLFLGSVSQWHGVDYLIDIFNTALLLKEKDIKLYIVGGKESIYVDLLKRKSVNNSNIIFKPPVDNEVAMNYINSANYCLLPVKQIRTSPGSPLKLYDYIACGKPVITQKDIHGYSDEVEKYNLGYTLDFTKSEEAAKEILEYSTNNKMESFFKNNRRVAETNVSWSQRIDNWYYFLKKLQ